MNRAASSPSRASQSAKASSSVARGLGNDLRVFGVRHQTVRRLARRQRMDRVHAGSDAGRHRHRAQFGRGEADHRMLGAGPESLPPPAHAGDEIIGVERHQRVARVAD